LIIGRELDTADGDIMAKHPIVFLERVTKALREGLT
jgi:hypothetical protein